MLDIKLLKNKSAFLWGPRKTGKTYWVKENFGDCILIDLLKSDILLDYASKPSLLREQYQEYTGLIIIDEIQMVPDLLNEIHWLIENTDALASVTVTVWSPALLLGILKPAVKSPLESVAVPVATLAPS